MPRPKNPAARTLREETTWSTVLHLDAPDPEHPARAGVPGTADPVGIVAIDPGATTGIALLTRRGAGEPLDLLLTEIPYDPPRLVEVIGQSWETARSAVEQGGGSRPGTGIPVRAKARVALVIEQFSKRDHAAELTALRVMGLLDLLVHQQQIAPMYQQPAQIQGSRPVIGPEEQRRLGLWLFGHEHAKDALRHGLVALSGPAFGESWWRILPRPRFDHTQPSV